MQDPQQGQEWEEKESPRKQTLEAETVHNKRETRALDDPYVEEVLTTAGPADVVQGYMDWFYGEVPGEPGGKAERLLAFKDQVRAGLNENIQGSYRFSAADLQEEKEAIATRRYLYQSMSDPSDEGAAKEMALFELAREAIDEAVAQRAGGQSG